MKPYDSNTIALTILRLKDEDLSKLSDQELLDKYIRTAETISDLIKNQPKQSETFSF